MGLEKFPDALVQIIFAGVIAVFVQAYAQSGHMVALQLSRDLHAAAIIECGGKRLAEKGNLGESILRAQERRVHGVKAGQQDFSILYEHERERYLGIAMAGIKALDSVRVFLFFVGLLFTIVGIVQGFASQQFPTNAEEAKMYSFTIIKALGLAYLPAAGCIGSTLVLYVLSTRLQSTLDSVVTRFEDLLYRVAILGEQPLPVAQTAPAPAEEASHAVTT